MNVLLYYVTLYVTLYPAYSKIGTLFPTLCRIFAILRVGGTQRRALPCYQSEK